MGTCLSAALRQQWHSAFTSQGSRPAASLRTIRCRAGQKPAPGIVAGVAGVISSAVIGSEIGTAIVAAMTATMPFGIVTGAILSGLCSDIAGGTVVAALGETPRCLPRMRGSFASG